MDKNYCWEKIINGEKILSTSEALEIEKIIKELRGEKGFRLMVDKFN